MFGVIFFVKPSGADTHKDRDLKNPVKHYHVLKFSFERPHERKRKLMNKYKEYYANDRLLCMNLLSNIYGVIRVYTLQRMLPFAKISAGNRSCAPSSRQCFTICNKRKETSGLLA